MLFFMIEITLVDGNQTYCQGLKTMLEQIEDFRVEVISPENFCLQLAKGPSSGILLVDEDLYQQCLNLYPGQKMLLSSRKTIELTMDLDERLLPPNGHEVIYKGSGKKEFEERIRKLTSEEINPTNI
jgi:hypothetical protein